MRRTLRAYIKQYLNRYKGGLALVAGLMIFHIFVLYICGIPAADIRYFAGLELVFFVLAAVFCGIRYWYRLRTVKRQIRDYMQGMQEQKKLKKSSEVTHHTAEKEEYYMFAVADQPYLKSQSVIKLIDRVLKNTGGKRLTFSLRCGDAVGNPCVFNSSLIPQLLSLEGDKGGRSVAKKHDCVYVDIADERELMDIDTYLIR